MENTDFIVSITTVHHIIGAYIIANVWNKLLTDYVHASNVNVVKNTINTYFVKVGST